MSESKPALKIVSQGEESFRQLAQHRHLNPLPRAMTTITPEQLWDFFEVYVQDCDSKEEPITMAGACLAMHVSRNYFDKLASDPRFSDVVELIRLRVEERYEQKLHSSASSGAQFWLKANRRELYGDRLGLGNPDGTPFNPEGSVSEMELLRRVGFLLAQNAKTIEGKAEPADEEEP